jgi:hypothetical protein
MTGGGGGVAVPHVNVDGVSLFLLTAATNWSILHPPDDI